MAGLDELARIEPRFGDVATRINVHDETVLPLRRWDADFGSLAKIIIGQQVSTASASAIHERLAKIAGGLTATTFLAMGEEGWKQAGLSRPKQNTLATIAGMIKRGQLDLAETSALPVEDALSKLLEIKGIGPWTAQLFLLSCAGNADAFPAGDIALQEAARDLFGLEARPDTQTLDNIAKAWSPLRAVAARFLWAHYRSMKQGREGAIT